MKILKPIILMPILLALGGCASGSKVYLAADEDEDYGIGGTGLVAQNIGSEGSGIIGEITGFGSIFVNGIEVENDASTIVSVNGRKVLNHKFEIGEVVEILVRDERALTRAFLVNIRHEVIGPVSEIDRRKKQFTILNQKVLFKDLPMKVEPGDFLSISGFRDGDGRIHASHIAAAKSGSVLVRGQMDRSENRLSMHGYDLAFANQPQPGNDDLKIEGSLAEGKINVGRAFPDRVTSLKVVSSWIVQGFPASYEFAWKDNEGLKKISGQSEPVIFRVRHVDENTPAKILLVPDDLPKGAKVSAGQSNSGHGNKSSPGRNGESKGESGKSTGGSGNNSGGGNKP